MDLVIKWMAQQWLDERIVGVARGRMRVTDVSIESAGDVAVEGDWQYRRPGPLTETVAAEVSEVEEHLKTVVADRGVAALRRRVEQLRTALANVADAFQRGARSPPAPEALSGPDWDAGPEKRAQASTAKLLCDLKAKMRSPDFEPRLAALASDDLDDANFRSMSLTDADLPAIVASLRASQTLTTLDLSYNDLSDAGLQPLLCALATDAAPNLKTLRLDRTNLTDIAKRQLAGLRCIRKHLAVSTA